MADLTSQVSIDLNLGVARLGSNVVEIASVENGTHIAPPLGPMVRQLSFEERNRIVWSAVGSAQPRDSVCRGIVSMTTVESGECDPVVLDVVSLALAGAALDTPPHAECILLIAKACGWKPGEIAEMPAVEVDRIAMQLAQPREDSSWNKIVFVSGGDSLESLRDELADNLISRAAINSVSQLAMAREQSTIIEDRLKAHRGAFLSDTARPQNARGHEVSVGQEHDLLNPVNPDEPGSEHEWVGALGLAEHPDGVASIVGNQELSSIGGGPREMEDPTDFTGVTRKRHSESVFPPPTTVNSEYGDPISGSLSIAWDRTLNHPSYGYPTTFPEAMGEGALGSAPVRFPTVPGLIKDESAAWRSAFAGELGFSNAGLGIEASSMGGFLLSGDVIVEADAIAALLNQEADLRGLDR